MFNSAEITHCLYCEKYQQNKALQEQNKLLHDQIKQLTEIIKQQQALLEQLSPVFKNQSKSTPEPTNSQNREESNGIYI